MRVGLVRADGKWANLALMKISTWHKKKGDEVDNYIPSLGKYDKIYMSKIFDFTKKRIPEGAELGGSGFDLKKKLPIEIENCFPDYSLYPDCDYAIGFTTRGCNRKCSFCIVPKKEGKLKVVSRLSDFYAGQKEIHCLDNNITMAPMEHFEFIINEAKKMKIILNFTQGLDFRLLNKEHLVLLKTIRLYKFIYFAWDNIQDEKKIRKGIELFKKYFYLGRAMVYVLIGYNSSEDEDIYRVEVLRGLGVNPFVMPFNKQDKYQKRFARYVNHKAIFKSVKWNEYIQ